MPKGRACWAGMCHGQFSQSLFPDISRKIGADFRLECGKLLQVPLNEFAAQGVQLVKICV